MRPRSKAFSRRGSVTSALSAASCWESAACFSAFFFAFSASLTRSRKPLISGPFCLRSSGVMAPSVLSNSEIEPFLPSAETRTASTAASSLAASIDFMSSASSCFRSVMNDSEFGMDTVHERKPRGTREGASRFQASERLKAGSVRKRGAGRIDDRLERCRLAHREIGEHLAVDCDPGLAEAVDKSAIGEAVLAHGGVDALDPEGAERALAVLAVAIGVLVRLFDRLLGDTDRVLAAAVVTLGGLQNLFVLGVGRYAAFDACHDDLSKNLKLSRRACRSCGRDARRPLSWWSCRAAAGFVSWSA